MSTLKMIHAITGIDQDTLRYVYKVTRIEQCLTASVATWLIALLSNGPLWFNTPKVAAAACMFCSVLGASLFHYGRRADVYERKWYDRVIVDKPFLLVFLGSSSFISSMLIALTYLPIECLWIAGFNFLAIMFYANFLDQYWPWKNIVIAIVCATPIMAGWFSGHQMHPIVPPLIVGIAGVYLAREMMKDVVDRRANKGKRFTMVMDLGVEKALKVAGITLLVSTGILVYAGFHMPLPNTDDMFRATLVDLLSAISIVLFIVGITFPLHLGWQLLKGKRFENLYRYVDGGIICLMLAVLGIRAGL